MLDYNNHNSTPWKNGHYRGHPGPPPIQGMLYFVKGEDFIMYPVGANLTNQDDPLMKGKWILGDFGEANGDVRRETGKSRYNVEVTLFGGDFKTSGVLSEDGKRLTFYGVAHAVDFLEWMSEDEVSKFKESGDPADAPPNHYNIQPEKQGKLLWIAGAPGLGKSTCGQLLSKNAGYVYYEGDAFRMHLNPYVPLENDEPFVTMVKQKFLKGVEQARIDAVASTQGEYFSMLFGNRYDTEKLRIFYSSLCMDINKERKRIGGDWVVVQTVPTRDLRNHIREKLGRRFIFIVLWMAKEDQLARITARHDEKDRLVSMLSKTYGMCEPASEDEPNSIHLVVTKAMTREDVIEKILCTLKKY